MPLQEISWNNDTLKVSIIISFSEIFKLKKIVWDKRMLEILGVALIYLQTSSSYVSLRN